MKPPLENLNLPKIFRKYKKHAYFSIKKKYTYKDQKVEYTKYVFGTGGATVGNHRQSINQNRFSVNASSTGRQLHYKN